jgi:hypothetical protein
MVKAGNKSNEIFTEVVSSLCQFVEHQEASLAMSDVVDHMHLDAILNNLDEDKFTSSMKKLLNKVRLEAETREKKCFNNVNLEDFVQDGATEFAQKGEKDVLVRMELKLRYLEDQLHLQQFSQRRYFDSKLQTTVEKINDVVKAQLDLVSEKWTNAVGALTSRVAALEQRIDQGDTSTAMDVITLKNQLEESQSQMVDMQEQVMALLPSSKEVAAPDESELDLFQSVSSCEGSEYPLKVKSMQRDSLLEDDVIEEYSAQRSHSQRTTTQRAEDSIPDRKVPFFMIDGAMQDSPRRSTWRSSKSTWRHLHWRQSSRWTSHCKQQAQPIFHQHQQSRKFAHPLGTQSVYGEAKPVDTSVRDREIEERLMEERRQLLKHLGLKSHYAGGKYKRRRSRAEDWHVVSLVFPRSRFE